MSMTRAGATPASEHDNIRQIEHLSSQLYATARRFCRSQDDADALAAETISRGKIVLDRTSDTGDMNLQLFKIMREIFLAKFPSKH